MTATVIAFINYKGGIAKTTTTYHVGCSLAQHSGKKVLMIDIDPQTNLTFLCASIGEWEQFKEKVGTIATMYRRFRAKKPLDTKRYIWPKPVGAALSLTLADFRRAHRLCGTRNIGSFSTIL
jgi:chromosome partitioning protein